jgi:hypothetical protein
VDKRSPRHELRQFADWRDSKGEAGRVLRVNRNVKKTTVAVAMDVVLSDIFAE